MSQPKRTMNTAQRLYEAGYITYMRTDCPTMSQQAHADVKQFISTTYGNNYYSYFRYVIQQVDTSPNSTIATDKQYSHERIFFRFIYYSDHRFFCMQ